MQNLVTYGLVWFDNSYLRRSKTARIESPPSSPPLLPIYRKLQDYVASDENEDWVLPSGPRPVVGPYQQWLLIVSCFGLSILASTVYMVWKLLLFWRLWSTASTFFLFFLLVEWSLYLSMFTWALEFSQPPTCRKQLRLSPPSGGTCPRVAILITSCNEEVDVLKDTVLAALAQKYPHEAYTVWVLDDGGDDELRDWVEALAQESGRRLRYLRRPKPKGVPHHFKAGNLNHALAGITDEFIAVLDADMITSPSFLSSVLPHFHSPKVAFVQTPQAFYNTPRGDPLNGSGHYFFDIVLPCRDTAGSAQCVGTGVVFRRSCLSDVGFFLTGAVTEDVGTSLKLHSRGWNSVFLKERFQMGLNPWTLEKHIKQQQRWCMGELQVVHQRALIWVKGEDFPLLRRFVYFQAAVHSFLAFPVVGLLLLAQALCFFDPSVLPLAAAEDDYRLLMVLMTPHLLCGKLTSQAIHLRLPGFLFRQQVRIRGEQCWWWSAPYKCMAVLRWLAPWIPMTFEATGGRNAEREGGGGRGARDLATAVWSSLQLVGFHLLYVVVGLVGIGWRISILISSRGQCSDLMKAAFAILFSLLAVQQMCEPILFEFFPPSYPVESDRKSLLKYDKDGIPVYRHDFGIARTDWRVFLLDVVPALQALLWIYFMWVGLHPDYVPTYCDGRFLEGTPI